MLEFKRAIRDKEKLNRWVSDHNGGLKAWGSFLTIVLFIFFVFSDGDFSFLLTLSSIISMFSFLMVIFMIEKSKSCSGVSLKMIECYVILLFARLCSIIPFEGYLPYDRTGDWLYQLAEAISFCLAGSIVYVCRVRHKETYEAGSDTLNLLFLIIPTAILALVFHPSLNAFMPADVAWTFALYLEAFCCLPQLFMFQKEVRPSWGNCHPGKALRRLITRLRKRSSNIVERYLVANSSDGEDVTELLVLNECLGGKVQPFTTHFLAAQALSKVMSFLFWLSTHKELNDSTKTLKSFAGVWVMVMQIIQLVVMGDFIYHYIRCLSRGVSVQFILTENV